MSCKLISTAVSLGVDNSTKSLWNRFCVLQEWQEATDSRAELLHYLKEQVPHIFCQKKELSLQEEEELMQSRLIYPLECFLFGEDPQEGFEKLKQGSSSSQLCGRVFKEGETVYSCRFGTEPMTIYSCNSIPSNSHIFLRLYEGSLSHLVLLLWIHWPE